MPSSGLNPQTQRLVSLLFLTASIGVLLYFMASLDSSHLVPMLLMMSPVFFLISFLSTQTGLVLMVLSMLLSPEIPIASFGRMDVIIRAEDVIIPILLLAWLARLAIRREFRLLAGSPLNKPIFFLIGLSVLSSIHGMIRGWVLSPVMCLFFFLKTLEFFAIFFLVLNFVRTEEEVRRLIFFALLTALVVGIYTLVQVPKVEIWTTHRITAPFEGAPEPATIGGYMAFLLLTIFGLFLYADTVGRKWFYAISGMVIFIPFLFTLNRTSYVALFAGLVFVAFVTKKRWIGFLLIAFLIGAPFLLPQAVKSRIAYTWEDAVNPGRELGVDQSFQERIYSFQRMWNTVKQSNPFIGLGVSTLPYPDNQYVRTIHEIGFIGLGLWLWIFLRLYRISQWLFENSEAGMFKGLALGYRAGLFALLLHALGASTFYIVRIMEPFCFLSGLVVSLYLLRCEEAEVPEPEPLAEPETA